MDLFSEIVGLEIKYFPCKTQNMDKENEECYCVL